MLETGRFRPKSETNLDEDMACTFRYAYANSMSIQICAHAQGVSFVNLSLSLSLSLSLCPCGNGTATCQWSLVSHLSSSSMRHVEHQVSLSALTPPASLRHVESRVSSLRCHPKEALCLPTFSHLLIVNKLLSLSLSLSLLILNVTRGASSLTQCTHSSSFRPFGASGGAVDIFDELRGLGHLCSTPALARALELSLLEQAPPAQLLIRIHHCHNRSAAPGSPTPPRSPPLSCLLATLSSCSLSSSSRLLHHHHHLLLLLPLL